MAVLLSGDSVSPRARAKPWLWFNLLSIDAPLVAVAWQLWFAQCFRVALAPFSVMALALTVWMIYTADRLLDVARSVENLATERHRFHQKHALTLSIAVLFCLAVLASTSALLRPVLVRDGLVLSSVVALYFVVVHAIPSAFTGLCPKEMAVGIVFALGTGLAPWSQLGQPRQLILPLALFASLCVLNCAAIEVWEWIQFGKRYSRSPHTVTLWLAERLRLFSALIAIAGLILFAASPLHMVFAAVFISALAFVWLDVERDRLPADLLRVLADVPLLSPLLLLRLH